MTSASNTCTWAPTNTAVCEIPVRWCMAASTSRDMTQPLVLACEQGPALHTVISLLTQRCLPSGPRLSRTLRGLVVGSHCGGGTVRLGHSTGGFRAAMFAAKVRYGKKQEKIALENISGRNGRLLRIVSLHQNVTRCWNDRSNYTSRSAFFEWMLAARSRP